MTRDKAIYLAISSIQHDGGICALFDPDKRINAGEALGAGVNMNDLYLTSHDNLMELGEIGGAMISSGEVDAVFVLVPDKLRVVK